MAYMGQEKKAQLLPGIKAVLAKYGMRGTVAVRHHSTLVVNITEGALDVIGNYNARAESENAGRTGPKCILATGSLDVNHYWLADCYTGEVLEFLQALDAACHEGNHDRSDTQSDYFDVGWYVDINVGKWDKPYRLLQAQQQVAA